MASALRLYNVLMAIGAFSASPWIVPYGLLVPKRRRHLKERLGLRLPRVPTTAVPVKSPLWIHALSVGETISALPLVMGILERYPNRPLFFSTSTARGRDTAGSLLSSLPVTHFTAPFDFPPFAVHRLFSRLRPALAVVVESDLWPNFLAEAQRHRVPVLLANARMSDRSFARFRRFRVAVKTLLSPLSGIGAQSRIDVERYVDLGVPRDRITLTGNLKFDGQAGRVSDDVLNMIRHRLALLPDQATIVAGSTHPGEEQIIARIASQLLTEGFPLKLILVPRHPERAADARRALAREGIGSRQWSSLDDRHTAEAADAVVVDRIGLLAKLYAVADLAIVGGSLIDTPRTGGHNPLEPAAFGKPVLAGPNMKNFKSIAEGMLAGGGLVRIDGPRELLSVCRWLLSDTQAAARQGRKARRFLDDNRGAVQKTLALLASHVEEDGPSHLMKRHRERQ
ncbi:MAG: 3-deoxy-D-manno-octulosonic acid transferase [Desulfobacterales bacterium]